MALDLNNPQAKATFLTSQGYDPTKYDLDDNYNLVPKSDFVETQPAIDIAHDPVATSQLQVKPPNQSTALQAFGHSALASTLPTLGGLGVGAIGAELAPVTGGLSLLIPLAAALAGGYGTSKLQNAVLPDSAKQELSTEEQEHPVASELGGLLPSLPFFNPLKGITELPQLAKSAGKLALGRVGATELGSAELGQLANAGINTGLNVGQNLAGQLGNGQPFNWGSLGLSTATGAIMNSPTPLGEKVFSSFGHPQTDAQPNASEGGDIVESQSSPQSQDYPTPNPISGEAPNPFQGLMRSGALPEQTAGGSLKGYPARMDKMANYAENTNPSTEDLSRLEGEGGPSAPQNPVDLMNEWMQQRNYEFQKANQERQQQQIEEASLQRAQAEQPTGVPVSANTLRIEKDKLLQPDVSRPASEVNPTNDKQLPVVSNAESQADLEARQQEAELSGEQKPKYSPEPNLTSEDTKKQNNRDWALLKNASADYRSKVADLAFKRGINLREAANIVNPDTASEVLGKYEGGTRTATVSTSKGELDTPIHEVLGHGFVDDLLQSKSVSDRNLGQRALDIFGGDKAKAEEELAKNIGVAGVKRAQTDLYGTKQEKFNAWLDDFKSRWKNNLGMANNEDVLRHLSARGFHDAPYGLRGELVGREKYNALVQQYKETKDADTKVAIAKDIEGLKNADGSGMPPKEQGEQNKFSEEPNLKKEDIKEQKPDITLKPFASETDTILNKEGERAKPATDAIAAFEADRPKKYNAYDAPEKAALKGLSGSEKTALEETLQKENDTKTNLRDTLPSDNSKEAYDAIRENIKKQAEDRIANKQPVWDVDKSGKPFAREHQIDPYYYPQVIDPKVIDTIRNKPTSLEAAAYKKSFNDYALSKGQTQAQADERWASLKQSNSKQKPDLAHFRAVDVASGIGLPKDFTRPGIERNLEHYNSRYATAASFHDNIENNPKAAPLFGIKNDPWGKPFEGADKVEPLSSKEAVGAFNRITGSDYSPEHSTINAAEKVATSSTLGFLTSWHIFASTTANALADAMPREIPSLLTHAATNIKEGYQHAFDNGLIRNKGQMLRDLFDSHSTAAERMNSLSDTISRINGHDTLGNAAKAFSQVLYEHMLRMRIPLAKAGGDSSAATQSIRMMKQVDPYWNASKDYSPDDISKMASRLVNMLHGSTSASQPAWMLNDSIIKPFLSLMSWNVAQTNRFMRNVVTPAVHDGNYTPLIMSTLGAVLGGYAIKEGREALANKKSPIPSLSEIAASNAKDSTKIPLYAYNLMAMTSFAGLGGVLSTGAKSLFDIAYKNPQQVPIFPLDEMLTNTGKTLSNAYAALANSDSKDYATISAHAISDLLRENIQAARIGASWGDEAGAFGKERQQKATLNKEEGQLRRFKMAEGMSYEDESSIDESNPYYNLGRKSFQRTTDIGRAMQELPDLISRAFQESNGNIEVLKNKLQSLKTSSYPSMPSPERTPMTFWKYVQYLNETEGPEKASQRVSEYMQNNMIDKFKGEMIPSF